MFSAGGVGTVQSLDPDGVFIYPESNSAGIRHGLCGDPANAEQKHMFGGANYMGGAPYSTTYQQGGTIEITVRITAHHKGWFEFYICDNDEGGAITTDCLKQLERDENDPSDSPIDPQYPGRYYCPPTCHPEYESSGTMTMRYKLPTDLSCEHCVLQWWWVSGNTCHGGGYEDPTIFPDISEDCPASGWLPRENSKCEDTGQYPEEFWNCADITIAPSQPGTPPTPLLYTPAPSPAPSTAPAPTIPGGERTCVSKAPHISDEWCQQVQCAQDYIDGGFCEWTEGGTTSPPTEGETPSPSSAFPTSSPSRYPTPLITSTPTPAPAPSIPPQESSQDCVSIVAHISNEWCQSVACDQVYIDAGLCQRGNSGNAPTPGPISAPTSEPSLPFQPSPQPNNPSSISGYVSKVQFEEMFRLRSTASSCAKGEAQLTYENFIAAADAHFPSFGRSGNQEQNLREIAAFLGQISQETTGWWPGQPYEWGLCFVEEVGCENGCSQYSDFSSSLYPPVPGKSYHGRGAMQISWNYNYGALSEELFGDKNVLLNDPDLLTTDGVLAFRASLWFWMTAQEPKPSAHDVMLDIASECPEYNRYNGYGMTTNIINGGLECDMATSQKVENRVQYYSRYADILGVEYLGVDLAKNDPTRLYCDEMRSYLAGACPN